MADRTVTMKGNPLALGGSEVKAGQKAPDFTVVNKDLAEVNFTDFANKVCIISCVPSLDTSVCDIMTRRFNSEAVNLGNDVVVLAISMDLPFGQNRWCIAADVKNVYVLSDHKYASFGMAYGMLLTDLRLLARGVFVVDKQGIIQYCQVVPEITNEPDYENVLNAVKKLL